MGDVRDAVRHIQEHRLRMGEDLIANSEEVKHLSPILGERVQEMCRIGVRPAFRGPTPHWGKRGLHYGRGRSKEIAKKLWKDVKAGSMFV